MLGLELELGLETELELDIRIGLELDLRLDRLRVPRKHPSKIQY